MRWLLRRLAFYIFALWMALTLVFLILQLLPGSPIGGILQHLSPAQIQSNPQIILTYEKLFGGKGESLPTAYWHYLNQRRALQLRRLDLELPDARQPGGRADASLLDRARRDRLHPRVHLRHDDRHVCGVAPRRRRRLRASSPSSWQSAPSPRTSRRCSIMYFLGLKLGWFPIQHAYGNDVTPGFNGAFIWSAVDHGFMPALVIVLAFAGGWILNMRTVMINTISEDYVAMAHAKGLKDRQVMTRYAARNAILPPLNGFAPQFATAVGGVVFVELVFSYPGAGYTLQQAALGKDLPLSEALLLFFAVCPIVAIFIIDLVNFALDPRIRAS